MKRVYQSDQFKQHQRQRARSEAKARRERADYVRLRGQSVIGLSERGRAEKSERKRLPRVAAPDDFSFRSNTDACIRFFNQLVGLARKSKGTFVVLKDVKRISGDAIAILCSIKQEYSKRHLEFKGDRPTKEEIRDEFERSGFFNYVQGGVHHHNRHSKDEISTQGDHMVRPERTAEIIKKAARTVWGEERRCPGIQKSLIECMGNTKEHAHPMENTSERWWLSVHHDDVKHEVTFSFVDYGVGIFESLGKKRNEFIEFFKRWGSSSNPDLMQQILEGELKRSEQGTRTGLVNRGKGLPGIREALNRNQLCDLLIVSNNVRADVSGVKYDQLSENFGGTFLQWKLRIDNSSLS
jgi:hypothetical protein